MYLSVCTQDLALSASQWSSEVGTGHGLLHMLSRHVHRVNKEAIVVI